MRSGRAALVAALVASAAGPAAARPEVTTDLAILYGRRTAGASEEGLFSVALHGTLLGDRESPRGFAAGVSAHLGATDFREAHAAIGGALLVPLFESFPIVLEAAPLAAVEGGALRSGALGRVSWGVHAFPRLGAYVLTVAVAAEARWLSPDRVDLFAGIDVDAFALVWPWMFLWEAL